MGDTVSGALVKLNSSKTKEKGGEVLRIGTGVFDR